MRRLLIYLSQARWARRLIMALPFARRTALRFVAGETVEEALRVVGELNEAGLLATLDLLGEHTDDAAKANESHLKIIELIEKLAASGLRSGVSIKLTQVGLKINEDLCARHVSHILETAARHSLFVRIDMEESAVTDSTLHLFNRMLAEGHANVGIVIQSMLYRSGDDVLALLQEKARIRLVKGAYLEPPSLAYPKKADVDASFDKLAEAMLNESVQPVPRGKRNDWPPIAAIATHDEKRIEFANQTAEKIKLPKPQYEFQMLHGIRTELQRQLAADGYQVRVYVPFGQEWYPYFMRRLAERPANLWFFLSNLVRR